MENQRKIPRSIGLLKRFTFTPHLLKGFKPRVSLWKTKASFLLLVVSCDRFVVILGAPNSVVGVCPNLIVKDLDSALKDSHIGR
jgi:hypothetical protein